MRVYACGPDIFSYLVICLRVITWVLVYVFLFVCVYFVSKPRV